MADTFARSRPRSKQNEGYFSFDAEIFETEWNVGRAKGLYFVFLIFEI